MKQPATINISTTQDNEKLSLRCDGCVYSENNTTFVEYTLNEKARVIMGISEDTVSISSIGDTSYTMFLQQDKSSLFEIVFSGHTISCYALAHKMLKKIDEKGVKLFLVYDLKFADHTVKHKINLNAQVTV